MAGGNASIGPSINIPEGARGTENASTPLDQRVPDRTTELSLGPKVGEKGEFLPARYPHKVAHKIEGQMVEFPVIIEDR